MNRINGWRLPAKEGPGVWLTPVQGEPVWVADKTQSFNAWVALSASAVSEGEHMTISAQVIDTIVEWMINLHQPLRIDDIARHAGYSKWHLQRLFLQYKGESPGRYIRERKLLLAARDLRDTDQRVYDICLKYGFDSQQTFTRVFTRPSISRRAPTAKRTTVAPTEARLSWFNARGKPEDATPSAAPDTQWRPALRTTDKTAPV